MQNNLQLFQNNEFGELEILMLDGKPYFPATECATLLGYSNPRKAVIDHCRCVTKRDVPHPQNKSKTIPINYIPEGDLYRLIARSKLPYAEKFECWVFDEVLPSIRKNGAYLTNEVFEKILQNPEYGIKLLQTLQAEREEKFKLESQVEYLAPKAQYCDLILQCKNSVPISLIAKDYGMSASAFNKLLNGLKIQYKIGGTWILYQAHCCMGYTKSKTYYTNNHTATVHTYWTQKGRLFLYEILKRNSILPIIESNNIESV